MSDSKAENLLAARPWLAPALLGAFAIACFLPVFLGARVWFLRDLEQWFYPSRMQLLERLAHGDLPLWNPQIGLGQPFAANPANSVFYPLNALLLLPAPQSVSQYLAVHLLLALGGAYGLVRALAVSRTGACVSALCFGMGGYVLSMAWSGTYLISVVWIPLVAWLAVRVIRTPRPARIALFALALGCQLLTGEVQAVAFSAVFVLALLVVEHPTWRARAIAAAQLGAGAALALLLAMPQILPALDVLGQSDRAGGIAVEQASHWSFHPLRFLELAVADLQGTPLDKSTYVGDYLNAEGGKYRAPWMVSPYFGSIALALALAGFALCRHKWARAVAVLATAFAALALGRHTPLFAAFYELVPGADLFRYPAKYFAVVALASALLAGAGFDRLLTGSARSRRLFLAALGIGAVTMGMAGLVVSAALQGDAMRTVRGALVGEALLVALLALALWLCHRRAPAYFGAATVAAVALQLAAANVAIAPATDPALFGEPAFFAERANADAPPGEWPRVIIDPGLYERSAGLSPSDPELAAFQEKEAIDENVGAIFGMAYPMPYSATLDASHRAWSATTEDMQPQAMNLYGVRYLVLPEAFAIPPALGFERMAAIDDMRIALYRNPRARPFAYPASHVINAASIEQALAGIRNPDVHRDLGAVIEGVGQTAGGARGTCTTTTKPADEIKLQCELDADGWVVASAAFHPGWSATVDGEPAPLHRANAVVMAAPVPAGRHEVVFVYSEPRLATGLWCALLAAIACLALFGLEFMLAQGKTAGPASRHSSSSDGHA